MAIMSIRSNMFDPKISIQIIWSGFFILFGIVCQINLIELILECDTI
jgi:hypothetical protein